MGNIINLKDKILPDWTINYQNEIRKMIVSWGSSLSEAEKDELDCIKWDALHIIKERRIPTFYVIANDPDIGVYIHLDSGVFNLSNVSEKEKNDIYRFCLQKFYNWVSPFRIILNQYGDLAVNYVSRLETINIEHFIFLINEIHHYSFTIQEELEKEFGR
jgi:hypothetical protein